MARNARKFVSRTKVQQTIDPSSPDAMSKVIEAINDINRELDNIRKHLEDLPLIFGEGVPTNEVTAGLGMLYVNKQGGTDTTLYIKETSDKKSDGWVAV